MIENYYDFIPLFYANLIEGVITHEEIEWHWQQRISSLEGSYTSISDIYDTQTDPTKCPPIFWMLQYLLGKIQDEILPGYHYTRIRAVATTPATISKQYNTPHVDPDDVSVIYYPYDSTGDTYVFGRTGVPQEPIPQNMEIVKAATPKKGRILVFPSNQYHAGSSPTSGRRMLINMNFAKYTTSR